MRIWFTQKLEPALSRIPVLDAADKEIDNRDVYVDRSNPALLEVSLPQLKVVKYKVAWRVVSVDYPSDNRQCHIRNNTVDLR
jgi:methionine-rich copper-binding protein CopC